MKRERWREEAWRFQMGVAWTCRDSLSLTHSLTQTHTTTWLRAVLSSVCHSGLAERQADCQSDKQRDWILLSGA